ncbi:MAG: hypothetical protein FWG64_11495 [Firmicutes bacterium]|nr:hypothetical protein [Bacillota bacterium]
MHKDWFESAQIVSYHLWETMGYDNALDLWYAVEDIACFFEQSNIFSLEMVDSIKGLGVKSEGYIWFLRNISYRLYLYTHNVDELSNWFLIEKLLDNVPWVENLAAMAVMLRKDMESTAGHVRSHVVRSFYGMQTF